MSWSDLVFGTFAVFISHPLGAFLPAYPALWIVSIVALALLFLPKRRHGTA